MIPNLKVKKLGSVWSKGFPKEADFRALDNLANVITPKYQEHDFARQYF